MTRPRRRGLTRDHVARDLGHHYIDVRCTKCRRRWMLLTGSGPVALETQVGSNDVTIPPGRLIEVEYIDEVTSETPTRNGVIRESLGWHNPWTGKRTSIKPGVTVSDTASQGLAPGWLTAVATGDEAAERELVQEARSQPARYRVFCHIKCGRKQAVTLATLQREYAEAVGERHAEIWL